METDEPAGSTSGPRPPAGSAIRVHAADENRLVLDIPPGKQAAGIGCFAIIWNGFMTVFTAAMTAALLNGKNKDFGFAPLAILSVFWLVGVGFIYAWVKLRFERCLLFVEHDRAVLRKILLGRQKQTELELDPLSRAELTESYRENERPVYRVTIVGAGEKRMHFGTSLDQSDKDWCVDAVNSLLQPIPAAVEAARASGPMICDACGATIPDDANHTLDGHAICPECSHQQQQARSLVDQDAALASLPVPAELPQIVRVLEDSPERLGLRLTVSQYPAVRWIVAVISGGFACFWYSVTLGTIGSKLFSPDFQFPAEFFDWLPLLFMIPFFLGGLAPLSIALLALFGRLTTWIDREQLTVRLHVGPLGKKWHMTIDELTDVRLTDPLELANRSRNPRVAAANPAQVPSQVSSRAAAAYAGPRMLGLTALHDLSTARYVVHKVRTWIASNLPEKRLIGRESESSLS